jgi:hypothetical protein
MDRIAPVVDIRDLQRRARARRREEVRAAWKEAELAAAVARATEMLAKMEEDEEDS